MRIVPSRKVTLHASHTMILLIPNTPVLLARSATTNTSATAAIEMTHQTARPERGRPDESTPVMSQIVRPAEANPA